jgi:hypothetical protein
MITLAGAESYVGFVDGQHPHRPAALSPQSEGFRHWRSLIMPHAVTRGPCGRLKAEAQGRQPCSAVEEPLLRRNSTAQGSEIINQIRSEITQSTVLTLLPLTPQLGPHGKLLKHHGRHPGA